MIFFLYVVVELSCVLMWYFVVFDSVRLWVLRDFLLVIVDICDDFRYVFWCVEDVFIDI